MPIFLDHHWGTDRGYSVAQVKELKAAINAGTKDKAGVRAIDGFWSNTEAWCLVEAPNADAVHKFHEEAFKIKLGPSEVKEVSALMT